MSAPTETELKLAVAANDAPRLRARLDRSGPRVTQQFDTIYHDTADFALARRGMALRVRRAGRRWVQTLKTQMAATALSRRGEWEMPAQRGRLDIARFAGTPLEALLRAKPALKIEPRFRTRFTRSQWITPDGTVEIALDEGEIVAGERTAPILELELELKSGDAAALWTLALDLIGARQSAIPLLPFGESKAARGVGLSLGQAVAPTKAAAKVFAAPLRARMSAGVALRAIIGTGTDVLLANVHGLRQGDDAEFVHQARVAVRRMRSAIRLFKDEVEFPQRLAIELRWIGRELGRARDWDVIVLHTLPTFAPSSMPDSSPLHATAARRRAEARQHARASLASARFAVLAVQLAQWAETPAAMEGALQAFAAKSLRRAYRRLLKAAQFFVALPAAQQHRVRILAKRLRYATDVLACAFARGAIKELSARLSDLQDVLGELNDIAAAQEILTELAPRSAELESTRSALARRRQALTLKSEGALAELAQLPEPWR